MVFCPSCDVENEEDATYCARCGEPLREDAPRVVHPRRRDEKDEKHEKHEKDELEEKTDTAARNWVTLFGLLVVISGVISLLDS